MDSLRNIEIPTGRQIRQRMREWKKREIRKEKERRKWRDGI